MRIHPDVVNDPTPPPAPLSTPDALAAAVLDWYDRSARRLPWRVPPGSSERPDPYRVWLSEIMLQQTTVAAATGYFEAFVARWPRVEDLAAAEDAEVMAAWAGLGYYARARNLLACARTVVARHAARFPDDEDGLRALPGVGPYTAAAVAAIVYRRPAVVVDGNVERVMARLHAIESPLPGSKGELWRLAARLTPEARPGDYAQAVMDLGATICSPRRPACGICPWRGPCAGRRKGIAGELPRKTIKAAKRVRQGTVYVAVRPDGAVMVETRPGHGLLGGMLGLPGTDWTETGPAPRPPLAALWRDAGEVRHTFTHFHLTLRVEMALVGPLDGPECDWRGWSQDLEGSLPTVMKKALRLGRAAAISGVGRPPEA